MVNKIIRQPLSAPGVIVDEVPADDEAYLLCLTSPQLHIVRKMVFPAAYFRTRFVRPVGGKRYERASEVEWLAYCEILEDLEDTLGGDAMPCSDIRAGLEAIAAALAGGLPGNVTQNVTCGGTGGGNGNLACLVAQSDPDDLLPSTPATEPEEGGDPPEGFESWDDYREHKC